MKKKFIKQKGTPLDSKDIKNLFKDSEIIYAYKYARATKNSFGNSTRFIKHKENTWIHDKCYSRYGLFFFTDKKYLLPYMTYGDILIRIKITKSDLKKMKIRKHLNLGICEYSCRTYYVDGILPLTEWDTLNFIATYADCNFLANDVKDSIKKLENIGVGQIFINDFKNILKEKGIK